MKTGTKLTEHEINIMAGFKDSEYGKVFLKILQREFDHEQDMGRNSMKICDDPLNKDFRWKLGEQEGLRRALDLPDDVIKFYQNGG